MTEPSRIMKQPTPGAGWTSLPWSATSLPSQVLTDSCRRVALAAWAFGGLWAFALLMHNLAPRLLQVEMQMSPEAGVALNVVGGAALALCVGLVVLVGALRDRHALLLDIGLVWFVTESFCVALLTYWEPQPKPWGLSWVALVIVAYPSIAPNTTAKVLVAGMLAATTDPISMLLARARGHELPYNALELAWLVVPNYLAALIALIPTRIIAGLGRQVKRARELGSYKLGESLGKGGMGEVYRAEHRLLARPAAIKVVRPELLGQDTMSTVVVERFKREAHAAALLRSPHTISLYDFGFADDGTFYYVMELLDGVDTDALVARFGPQPPERVAHLVSQACSSLAEAHRAGLVHRDVKPSNLFVSRLGLEVDFVKVLDFGLVKVRGGTEAGMMKLTGPNVVAGTPTYMAPEVAMGERAPDPRADVYALGCCAYWLLTGKLVFEADTPMKMMLRHIQDQPVPPSQRSEFPEARLLDEVIMRCLAKAPEQRPGDAGELRGAFEAVEFPTPWTTERARRWWETNLPGEAERGPCDRGELMPMVEASEP